MLKSSDIRLTVDMDDDGVEAIRWEADDALEPGVHDAGAMILALWEGEQRHALRIDLWVKDLSVDDMNDFFFQTFLSMADTCSPVTSPTRPRVRPVHTAVRRRARSRSAGRPT